MKMNVEPHATSSSRGSSVLPLLCPHDEPLPPGFHPDIARDIVCYWGHIAQTVLLTQFVGDRFGRLIEGIFTTDDVIGVEKKMFGACFFTECFEQLCIDTFDGERRRSTAHNKGSAQGTRDDLGTPSQTANTGKRR